MPSTSPTTLAHFTCLRLCSRPMSLHGVQNAAMHRLQTVAHVGQRAPDDDRHRIVEIRALHLLFNVDGLNVGGAGADVIEWKLLVRIVCHDCFQPSAVGVGRCWNWARRHRTGAGAALRNRTGNLRCQQISSLMSTYYYSIRHACEIEDNHSGINRLNKHSGDGGEAILRVVFRGENAGGSALFGVTVHHRDTEPQRTT